MWERTVGSLHSEEYRCDADTSVYIRMWEGRWFVWRYNTIERASISDPYPTFEAAQLAAELMYL
jgi:hypothetical protein